MKPTLPDEFEMTSIAGEGRRSVVYKGQLKGETVALKVYKQAFIDKYRSRYKVNIADFEMSRNKAFFNIPELSSYAARPIAVFGEDGGHSLAFAQEYIGGIGLVDLWKDQGALPESVLNAGETIVRHAELAGLHDLDLFYKNILVREQNGVWLPVVHDFNLMPQHRFPPNPFLAFMYSTGLRAKSHRDYRCIAQWKNLPIQ
jgi:hypothetical protein